MTAVDAMAEDHWVASYKTHSGMDAVVPDTADPIEPAGGLAQLQYLVVEGLLEQHLC